MSADLMTFPNTVEEFMEKYKMVDTDHIYSNGVEYVPIYRMRQWFEHQADTVKHGRWIAVENDVDYYPFMCSECYETVIKRTNYCPRCGAQMDLDEVTE